MQNQILRSFISLAATVVVAFTVGAFTGSLVAVAHEDGADSVKEERMIVMNQASSRLIQAMLKRDPERVICRNTASMGAGVCTGVVVFECFHVNQPSTFCCGVSPNALDTELSDECRQGQRLMSFPGLSSK